MNMRRVLAVAAAAVVNLAALTASQARAASLPAYLRGYNCVTAYNPLLRAISVTAVMRPVTGTAGFAIKFDLLRARGSSRRFTTVRGPNLGRWLSSSLGQRPGDVWILSHPVVNLSAPARYRLRVTFRWRGAGGRQLGQLVAQTPVCRQLELRPDLAAGSLTISPVPGNPAQDAYVATVVNHGISGAGPFDVRLAVRGGFSLEHPVDGLGAHGTLALRLLAPACAAGVKVTLVVDPRRQVDDYDRANNTRSVACPKPGSA